MIQLNTRTKARRESGCFVAEGYKLFCETPEFLRRAVFVSASFAERERELVRAAEAEIVEDALFRKMCDTQTPQGILTVAGMPQWDRSQLLGTGGKNPLILILEDVQDPGNVGTMIRTAEGAGVTGIIISKNTADVFSPKVIRATMGSIFRVPLRREETGPELMGWLHDNGIRSYASHLSGKHSYTDENYQGGTAFLIGNEGNGLSPELTAMASERIRIPMEGAVESLNASVAAALLMYEAHRQRIQEVERCS